MTIHQLTKNDVETARGEIFHMILFAMAWVMIGEYSIDFKDYVAAAGIVLAAVVMLAFYSISLFNLEESVPDEQPELGLWGRRKPRTASKYAVILIIEGIAIMATWIILIRTGHEQWLIPDFAMIAGLHFFPLARVIRVNSYFLLGTWITLFTLVDYWLLSSGRVSQALANAIIAYGCAAGAVVDGAWIAVRTKARVNKNAGH